MFKYVILYRFYLVLCCLFCFASANAQLEQIVNDLRIALNGVTNSDLDSVAREDQRLKLIELSTANSYITNNIKTMNSSYDGTSPKLSFDQYSFELLEINCCKLSFEKIRYAQIHNDSINADTIFIARKKIIEWNDTTKIKYNETVKIYIKFDSLDASKMKIAGIIQIPDADADGFQDDNGEDDCVGEKGIIRGCPDRDGDNIIDKDDDCPDDKENKCLESVILEGPGEKKPLFTNVQPAKLAYEKVDSFYLKHINRPIDFLKFHDSILYSCTKDGHFKVTLIEKNGEFRKGGEYNFQDKVEEVKVYRTNTNKQNDFLIHVKVAGDEDLKKFRVTITKKKLKLKKYKDLNNLFQYEEVFVNQDSMPELIKVKFLEGKKDARYIESLSDNDFTERYLTNDSTLISITPNWIILIKSDQLEILQGVHTASKPSKEAFPDYWFPTNIYQKMFDINKVTKAYLSADGNHLIIGMKNGFIFSLIRSTKDWVDT